MGASAIELIAQQTYRIGVQRLYRVEQRYYVSLQNRTYRSRVEIPPERVAHWQMALSVGGGGWKG